MREKIEIPRRARERSVERDKRDEIDGRGEHADVARLNDFMCGTVPRKTRPGETSHEHKAKRLKEPVRKRHCQAQCPSRETESEQSNSQERRSYQLLYRPTKRVDTEP